MSSRRLLLGRARRWMFLPLTVLMLSAAGCNFEERTAHARQVLTETFDSLRLPPTLEFIRVIRGGSLYPFESTEPFETRIYRVVGDPIEVRSTVIDTLGSQGLDRPPMDSETQRIQDKELCIFRMKGRGMSLTGSLERRIREVTRATTGGVCPKPAWKETYFWLSLHVEDYLLDRSSD